MSENEKLQYLAVIMVSRAIQCAIISHCCSCNDNFRFHQIIAQILLFAIRRRRLLLIEKYTTLRSQVTI